VSRSPDDRRARFLFAMFQGGGNIPLILPVAAELVARGHQVRVLAGPGIRRSRLPVSERFRQRIAAAGAVQVPFEEPPEHPLEGVRIRGLLRGWTPSLYKAESEGARVGHWSPSWAQNVARELRREPADVVAADFALFGAMAAAEAAQVPFATLVHNVPWRTAWGVPPHGPGFQPARTPRDRLRDDIGNMVIERVRARDGLAPLNRARVALGLRRLRSPFEQFDAADRVLVLTSRAFDFLPRRLPPNVRYVGTPFDDAGTPCASWRPPASPGPGDPLILVSLSTLNQGQAALMHRILQAVGSLPARVVVTLGLSLDSSQFVAPPNVTLEGFVPHAAVLPHVTAMVTQCGLGTLMKALAHQIPLVCLPFVGDQPDNAARVVAHGAGVRLGADATPEQIRAAIMRVLNEPIFREGARRLGRSISADDGARNAAEELELLASPNSRSPMR
jgi:MGT family glycosyltransferase